MRKLLLALIMGIFMTNPATAAETQKAYFAGGCFWCMESEFQTRKGVTAVTSGFVGPAKPVTYEAVAAGAKGYVEAVEVEYDPAQVTYPQLLDIYWSNIDPTDAGGQFYDRGPQYQTVIYVRTEVERLLAEGSRLAAAAKLGKELATRIEPMQSFQAADTHHQDYYKTSPDRYEAYVKGSGRKEKLKKIWNKQ